MTAKTRVARTSRIAAHIRRITLSNGSMPRVSDLFDRAAKFFHELQSDICDALAEADGRRAFGADAWQRPGGGGGVARVLEDGAVFEKAGVNWSNVDGELPAELATSMPGIGQRVPRGRGVAGPASAVADGADHACQLSLHRRRATRCGSAVAPTSRRTTCSATTRCTSTRRSRTLRSPPPGRRLRPLQEVVRRVLLPPAPRRDPRRRRHLLRLPRQQGRAGSTTCSRSSRSSAARS